ncbi:DUF1772 domain-containing protein [Pseudonocardia oroxyli]|uniref:DUF1772 domain-containing protein n=1 Tax=Pseudonocardia oroxyli TaxID=366584 RepID=A0A1G7ZPY9_PSEOR|nr:DUF1772 domain-containing protein [Pseudonocardia oroxyli]SDH10748.1 protein of unknown function [Pseudonocardia oroxyli]
MTPALLSRITALVAIMSTGIVYGTDVFCALVQRSALARVDDATLTAVMGNVHRVADRRMPVPGILGIVAAAAASALAAVAGHPVASATAGAAFLLMVVWVLLYLRISAPLNRILTAAADAHETPADVRSVQQRWDHVIVPRAVLQGLAVLLLLGVSLVG